MCTGVSRTSPGTCVGERARLGNRIVEGVHLVGAGLAVLSFWKCPNGRPAQPASPAPGTGAAPPCQRHGQGTGSKSSRRGNPGPGGKDPSFGQDRKRRFLVAHPERFGGCGPGAPLSDY